MSTKNREYKEMTIFCAEIFRLTKHIQCNADWFGPNPNIIIYNIYDLLKNGLGILKIDYFQKGMKYYEWMYDNPPRKGKNNFKTNCQSFINNMKELLEKAKQIDEEKYKKGQCAVYCMGKMEEVDIPKDIKQLIFNLIINKFN